MIDKQKLIEFARHWSKMNAAHVEQRVAQWLGNYGLFFVGSEEKTLAAIDFMLSYLQPDAVIRYTGQSVAQWDKNTETLFERNAQRSLLKELPSRVCIVTPGLERPPQWLVGKLKRIFEGSVIPVLQIATATADPDIPDHLLSHYYQFQATKNLRKVSDAYKSLPGREPPDLS